MSPTVGRFVWDFPTANLRAATYNPRKIAPDALNMLVASITAIGFCKPIIATDDGLILAGHQRTKAAHVLDMPYVPAWVISSTSLTLADETRFNQLHNGTDLDQVDAPVRVPPGREVGFFEVEPGQIQGNLRSRGAIVRQQICDLMVRYGRWGAAVATYSGLVVSSPQYALACKLLGVPCRVHRVPDDKEQEALGWFARAYGEFSYDHLPRDTFVQTFAQPLRLRAGGGAMKGQGRNLNSVLYEAHVLRKLQKSERLLDLGCGQRDYVDMLRAQGYSALGMEFYYRNGNAIDTRAVHAMCDELFASLRAHGLFDVTMADSVINSVDTMAAENDVLTVLNAFCRPNGRIYFSGRRKELVKSLLALKSDATRETRNQIYFLDKNGFSAILLKGSWLYQKFHSKDEALALARRYCGTDVRYRAAAGWIIEADKRVELPDDQVEAAIRREFDLIWPDGHRVNRADDAVAAWRAARATNCEPGVDLPRHYPACASYTAKPTFKDPCNCAALTGGPFPLGGDAGAAQQPEET